VILTLHGGTMKKHYKKPRPRRALTVAELRTIAYVATLILAGYLVHQGVESPAAWGFLGGAIGALLGRMTEPK